MDNQVKIGVFFCTCGQIMSDYFDMKVLLDYARRIPGVINVDENHFLCTRSGFDWLKTKITHTRCNRVVIVGCSPLLYEQSFMKVMEEAGLNKYFLSIANIREGCAWVCREKENLMSRGRQIIAAAVKRVKFAKPVEKVRKKINRSVLVIGAGFTGIQTALELQCLGIKPILVEKQAEVSRKNPPFFIPCIKGVNEQELFSAKMKDLQESKIELLTSTEVKEVGGNVGSFQVTLDTRGQEKAVEVGAVVVSTGDQRQGGQRIQNLPKSRRIVSLSQLRDMVDFEKKPLERMLVTSDKLTKYVCFILGDSEGFTKTNTIMALNEAIFLKEQFKAEIVIAVKDISVSGTELESLYRQAREKGVLFYRYREDLLPEISLEKGVITVRLHDPALAVNDGEKAGYNIAVSSDLLILEDEIYPHEDTDHLKDVLDITVNQWGFFQEKNIHLKPNLSNKKGIFLAGACHGEEDIYETLNDIRSVVSGVYSYLSQDYLELEKKINIDTDKCVLCLTCFRTCPHRAIEIGDEASGQPRGAIVNVEACQGCGICVGECPAKAIEMVTYSDNQIFSELTFEG
ncbi:MAG: CoB--CoM heterodisulfide reductase iron-sulfur subunit A family protein [Deltaproteobacteria bacterium]|nr:CoB--CoM heterodisulfide reductase iron-sulfur subunit A family protein [Deltaproteobacteria bacterium]